MGLSFFCGKRFFIHASGKKIFKGNRPRASRDIIYSPAAVTLRGVRARRFQTCDRWTRSPKRDGLAVRAKLGKRIPYLFRNVRKSWTRSHLLTAQRPKRVLLNKVLPTRRVDCPAVRKHERGEGRACLKSLRLRRHTSRRPNRKRFGTPRGVSVGRYSRPEKGRRVHGLRRGGV